MEKAKVYYSDLRTSPTSNLLDKMERLLKRAGIEQLPLKDSFAAIKIHFGEPGMSYPDIGRHIYKLINVLLL